LTPQLVADIGGTNARFALVRALSGARPVLDDFDNLKCADFNNIDDALESYLHTHSHSGHPEQACLAIAAPVKQEPIKFPNNHWVLNKNELSKRFSFKSLNIINDFESIAYSLPHLTATELVNIGDFKQENDYRYNGPNRFAVMGPGTGFGAAGLFTKEGLQEALVTEAGHTGFAPTSEEEIEILKILRQKFQRVSVEDIVSGPGIVNLYEAIAVLEDTKAEKLSADLICAAAIEDSAPLCRPTLTLFCKILGSVAGDIALATGAIDGVYLAGGILPKYLSFLKQSPFREAFEDKGSLTGYMELIPTQLITYSTPGLLGASIYLASRD
jgi:glucokinase